MVAEGTPLTVPEVALAVRQAPRVLNALVLQATRSWAVEHVAVPGCQSLAHAMPPSTDRECAA